MNTNYQVDTEPRVRYSLSVDSSRDYVGSLKSPVSSTGRCCPQHIGQHGAGAFNERTIPSPTGHTTPRGATSDNVHSTARVECPLCCIAGSIPCGSGKALDKNSWNTDNLSSLSAPADAIGRQESFPAYFLPVVLLVPYCLMAFGLLQEMLHA